MPALWAASILLTLLAGSFLAYLAWQNISAAIRDRAERSTRRALREFDAAAAGGNPRPQPAHAAPPALHVGPVRIEHVHTAAGPVPVVRAFLSPAAALGGEATQQALAALLNAAPASPPRILLDIPSGGPSSRLFFWQLRNLGAHCAAARGMLVIRSEQPHASPFYLAASKSDPEPDTLALAATAEPLSPPPLDEL